MSEKFIIFNKRLKKPLSFLSCDKKFSKIFIGDYDKALIIKDKQPNPKDLQLMPETEYFQMIQMGMEDEEFVREEAIKEKVIEDFSPAIEKITKYFYDKNDRNLNGFPSISRYNASEDMETSLWNRLTALEDYFNNKPAFQCEKEMLNNLHDNIKRIHNAWICYKNNNVKEAIKEIFVIINKYKDDPFFVSELETSYALKQMAYYDDITDEKAFGISFRDELETLKKHPLTLFRGRYSKNKLSNRKDILHPPYSLNDKENLKQLRQQRFVCQGMAALYLCNTAYACWLECGSPKENFYISAFIPDEKASCLKILNLLDIEQLINGFGYGHARCRELQNKAIELFPLVLATSFKIKEKACMDEKKEETSNNDDYIISELVMHTLRELNIDGVAYLSKHLDHDLNMLVAINIVIPVYKDNVNKDGYGEICQHFNMTAPVKIDFSKEKEYAKAQGGSYISDYCKTAGVLSLHPVISTAKGVKSYDETVFGKFENYLLKQEMSFYNDADMIGM